MIAYGLNIENFIKDLRRMQDEGATHVLSFAGREAVAGMCGDIVQMELVYTDAQENAVIVGREGEDYKPKPGERTVIALS